MASKPKLQKSYQKNSQKKVNEAIQPTESFLINDQFLEELELENQKLEEELNSLYQIEHTKKLEPVVALISPNRSTKKLIEDNKQLIEEQELMSHPSPMRQPLAAQTYSPLTYQEVQETPERMQNNLSVVKLEEKITSLEMRLTGSVKTIKKLEKELKERDEAITQLKRDQQNKSKYIEQLEQNLQTTLSQSKQQSQQQVQQQAKEASLSQFKKKEKEMEDKIKQLEKQLNESKKNIVRANEVNQELMLKIKDDKEQNGKTKILEARLTGLAEKDSKWNKFVGQVFDNQKQVKQKQGEVEECLDLVLHKFEELMQTNDPN